MVEVTVARLGLDSSTNSYVVILQEKGGLRLLPIWIGQAEAESIATHMNQVKRERPMTHDLCRHLIVGLGAQLRRVQITRVQENTYYAELHLQQGEGAVQVDARPSDSIAIALRLAAPIFVQESLLSMPSDDDDEARDTDDDAPQPDLAPATDADALSAQQLKAYLEQLRPEDFGKFKL